MKVNFVFFYVALMVCALVVAHAEPTVWYVHPESTLNSIQAALDSCANNDIVLVGPGIYYENISWPNTQGIHLISELGADTTIIDGMNNYPYGVISIQPGLDSTTLIKDFTIQNGASMFYGGGIWCYQSSPQIISNIIRYNSCSNDGGGGGIAAWQGSPYICDNIITENYGYGADGGSGIFLCRSNTVVERNIISLNEHYVAVRCVRCTLSFRCNLIQGNLQSGIDLVECSISIDSCSIINNTHNGVTCSDTGDVTINYCNIYGNTEYGIRNYTTDIINAEYNWWGDVSGPYHPDSNPSGLGDTVSDWVDFIPWLDQPVGIWEKPNARPIEKHEPLCATIFSGPLLLPTGNTCKVFDITGRIVMPDKIKPGIYFIEIDGKITRKVIKVR